MTDSELKSIEGGNGWKSGRGKEVRPRQVMSGHVRPRQATSGPTIQQNTPEARPGDTCQHMGAEEERLMQQRRPYFSRKKEKEKKTHQV